MFKRVEGYKASGGGGGGGGLGAVFCANSLWSRDLLKGGTYVWGVLMYGEIQSVASWRPKKFDKHRARGKLSLCHVNISQTTTHGTIINNKQKFKIYYAEISETEKKTIKVARAINTTCGDY